MKLEIVLLLALAALATAMIPRDRRAVESQPEVTICAPLTPCGWQFYNPHTKEIINDVVNKYCRCGTGTECQVTHDDSAQSTYTLHCKAPSEVKAES